MTKQLKITITKGDVQKTDDRYNATFYCPIHQALQRNRIPVEAVGVNCFRLMNDPNEYSLPESIMDVAWLSSKDWHKAIGRSFTVVVDASLVRK